MRIYVASSWRNEHQPNVVSLLRMENHEVYDFRCPEPDNAGFSWSEIDPGWKSWTTDDFTNGLLHPSAELGFNLDMQALNHCDACVLVLPCGRSAHLELGHANGMGKHTYVYVPPGVQMEPELMYKMCDFITDDMETLKEFLNMNQRILIKGFY
jgi:hypothetical protein